MDISAINWEVLAEKCGALSDGVESGGEDIAREAIVKILGDSPLRDAVDLYVSHGRGSELARSVLMLLLPTTAIQRCLEIVSSVAPLTARRSAAELFRSIAGRGELVVVGLFLVDPDPDIQTWGASFLDQLVFKEEVTLDEAEEYVRIAESHESPAIQRAASQIRDFFSRAR